MPTSCGTPPQEPALVGGPSPAARDDTPSFRREGPNLVSLGSREVEVQERWRADAGRRLPEAGRRRAGGHESYRPWKVKATSLKTPAAGPLSTLRRVPVRNTPNNRIVVEAGGDESGAVGPQMRATRAHRHADTARGDDCGRPWMSQIRAVFSALAVASHFPSGLNARATIAFVCPRRIRTSRPVSVARAGPSRRHRRLRRVHRPG